MNVRLLPISGISPALKAKVAAEADGAGKSMNDVMVGALATKFNVAVEGLGGRPRPQKAGADSTALRLPESLYLAIDRAKSRAPKGQRSMNAVVLRVLHDHFGLIYSPPVRRRRRRSPAVA